MYIYYQNEIIKEIEIIKHFEIHIDAKETYTKLLELLKNTITNQIEDEKENKKWNFIKLVEQNFI